MTEVLGPAWTSPIYGLRTRNRHPIRNRQSPSNCLPVSISPSGSRPPGRRMAGDGDLRSFNPHPPLLHLHQTRRKPPRPRRSGALRTASAETARSEPSLTPGDPDVCRKVSVSPLPPGASTHRKPGARLSRRRGHKRPPRTQSAWRRVGSYDVLPPLPRPSLLAVCKLVRRPEWLHVAPRSGWHS